MHPRTAAFLTITLGLASGAHARPNLIANPSFEANGGRLAGWTMTSGDDSAAYGLVTPGFACTGNQWVFMANCKPTFPISLSQVLGEPLTSGQAYTLSFRVYNLGLANDELSVLFFED